MRNSDYTLDQLVFIDESHFNARTAERYYGISVSGEPAFSEVSAVRGLRLSAIAAVSLDGVIAVQVKSSV